MGDSYNHSAILQRLNVFHTNSGKNVYYSLSAFQNADDWNGVPIIMSADPTAGHPDDFGYLEMGHIPEGYRLVGFVTGARIPEEGSPRLEAEMYLYDYRASELAKAGKLGLSTGFKSDILPREDEENTYDITGTVVPNHVLVFEEGVVANAYPNDQGAMLTNQIEVIHMTNEEEADFSEKQKGWFRQTIESLFAKNEAPVANEEPLAEVQAVEENGEIEDLKKRIAELEKALEERDAIIAELRGNAEQAQKDEAWGEMKNQCPEGWLENEAQTRAEFEADPAKFANKLVAHMKQFGNMAPAEGNAVSTATVAPTLSPMEQYIKETESKFGVSF